MKPLLLLLLFLASACTADTLDVSSFGAKGDARKVTDAVLSGSTVTSATANFTTADLGRMVWGIETASGAARLPVCAVTSINSESSITVSGTAGNYSGVSLVIGTDDSDAIRQAAITARSKTPRHPLLIPSGGYIFRKLLFDDVNTTTARALSVIGSGSGSTVFYCAPNFDYTTTDNYGLLFNRQSNVQFGEMSGISIDGGGAAFDYLHSVASWGSGYGLVKDFHIVNFKAVIGGIVIHASSPVFERMHIESVAGNGIYSNTGGFFRDCYSGNNGGVSAQFTNCGRIDWHGGVIDESDGGGFNLQNCANVSVSQALFYSADGSRYALQVDGSSKVTVSQSSLIPFGSAGNRGGLKVLAGGTAVLSQTLTGSNGSVFSIDNAGTVINAGGNTFGSVNGTAPVPSP